MKKLLILAIAVLAFTACTKENTIQSDEMTLSNEHETIKLRRL